MPIKKLLCAFGLVLITAGAAHANLNAFIQSLNVSAAANIGDFRTRLGVQYGASGPTLNLVMRSVDRPADAAVILWLGQQSRQPIQRVLRVYRSRKRQGWGAIARDLGIKPGSAAFHALKAGNLGWSPAGRRGARVSRVKERERERDEHWEGDEHGGRGRHRGRDW